MATAPAASVSPQEEEVEMREIPAAGGPDESAGGEERPRRERRRSFEDAARALDQQGGASEGGCCGVAWPVVLPHACCCAFLALLALRLRDGGWLSWRAVFAPTWVGDVATMARRVEEAVRARREAQDALRPAALGMDALGIFAAKTLVCLELEGTISRDAVELLSPFFVGISCSAVLRGVAAVKAGRQKRSEEDDAPSGRAQDACAWLVAVASHLAGRGLQPALVAAKLDGIWHASSWGVVFAPAWVVLAVLASVAATLCNCTPLLSAGMPTRVRRQAIRLVSLCAAQLVAVAGCVFVFAFLLAKRLDARDRLDERVRSRRDACAALGDDDALAADCADPGFFDRDLRALRPTTTAILAPLVLMYLVLFVLHPLVVRDSRKFQQIVRVVVVEADDSLDDARAALAAQRANVLDILGAGHQMGVEDDNVIVEALAVPTRLLQHSGTLYQRAAPVSPADLETGGPSEKEDPPAREPPRAAFHRRDDIVRADDSPRDSPRDSDASFRSVESETHNEEDPANKLCYVCCVERRNAVLFECGHGGVCFPCAQSLATRHPRTCPICRQPITAVLKVKRRDPGSNIVLADEGILIRPSPSASRLLRDPPNDDDP